MKTKLLFVAIAGSLTGSAMAIPDTAEVEKPAPPEATASVADAIDKDIKDFGIAYRAFTDKVRAEKDRNAARELYKNAPKADPYVERVLTLAEKNPTDAAAKKGLLWCQNRARQAAHRQRISKMFTDHYMNDPIINEYARSLSRSYSPNAEASLREIIEKATNKGSKVYATYYLASKLGNSRISMRLPKDEQKAKADESMKLMKQLHENPEVAKLSPKMAKKIAATIFEKEKLGIGCTAPDIEGDDHTGTVFKLSDYRGKVILLDFWGIW